VRVVVADAGPLIGQVDLLPGMFEGVWIPAIVRHELDRPQTPKVVRDWITAAPAWLSVVPEPIPNEDPALAPWMMASMPRLRWRHDFAPISFSWTIAPASPLRGRGAWK
jgi:hypothetical protein